MAAQCPTPSRLASTAPSDLLPLITLAIGFVMAMLDVTAVNVALADISHNLRVPLSGLVWVIDGYTLTFAALLLVGGALADRYGAKTVYLGGLAVFMLGSALCGAAPDGNTLIAARMLQGVGSALFMPSSLSLLTHAYHDDRVRARMLGTWSAIVAVAAAMGPLAGGVLVDRYGWRSVFLINLPVGLLGLLLAQGVIPAVPRHWRALPIFSHALGIGGLASLCFTLIEGPVYGWTSAPILISAILFAMALALLVWRERRGAEPLLPRALFETARFAAANGIGFLINFGAFGQLFLLSLFLQQARGSDALHTGLQLLPVMAVFSIGNLLSGRITVRWGGAPADAGRPAAGDRTGGGADRLASGHLLSVSGAGRRHRQLGRRHRSSGDDHHRDANRRPQPRQQRRRGPQRQPPDRRPGRRRHHRQHPAC